MNRFRTRNETLVAVRARAKLPIRIAEPAGLDISWIELDDEVVRELQKHRSIGDSGLSQDVQIELAIKNLLAS